ncbi:hypothetical protein KPH14_004708 [Odynerus spinipes]|uniref:Uncharacterized protein n=1 Tax=Odynerus spinipes TaxID=1348599 RepID=A0AAD9VPX7_9HYME|nr:hypothetical protein KPH14_004708 [Odynerus spinipes]
MFYLNGRGSGGGGARIDRSPPSEEDEFGWFIGNVENVASSTLNESSNTKNCLSSDSSTSMLSCIDPDEQDVYALASDFTKRSENKNKDDDNENICENIELSKLDRSKDLNLKLIENDADMDELGLASPVKRNGFRDELAGGEPIIQQPRGMCYTPERLVRCEEYRILIPSPRCLSISREKIHPENENSRKTRLSKRRLNSLIDSKQTVGAPRLKALLESYEEKPDIRIARQNSESFEVLRDVTPQDSFSVANRTQPNTLQASTDTISNRSSYERLSVTWEDFKKQTSTRRSSLEDTSGIHSNDWSSETQSDTQTNPLCLCDELAVASSDFSTDYGQVRSTAINEVVSILQALESDPEKATVLLEEDRFCGSTSSHDHITRLALTIETDANVPAVLGEPEKSVYHLRRRVERLQHASKDIFKDICALRKDFEYEEEKLLDLSSDASRLRQDIHEVRYIDDLLRLLRGELERISNRNWPFVLGHSEQHGELNLVV